MIRTKSFGRQSRKEYQNGGTCVLVSYRTPVAAYVDGAFWITDRFWSVTTSRHINKWLGENGARAGVVKRVPQADLYRVYDEMMRRDVDSIRRALLNNPTPQEAMAWR